MELDGTTFVLEIINFLILVWILNRLLYKPVMQVIERRRVAVAATLEEARQREAQAEAQKAQYEGRMTEWDKERETARAHLDAELAELRQQRMSALEQALEAERERQAVVQQRLQDEHARAVEEQAIAQGGEFAARLLQRLGGPALDQRIAELVIEDLAALSDERRAALSGELGAKDAEIVITSAHALPAALRERLDRTLAQLGGAQLPPRRYEVDDGLIGGLRIAMGAWALKASVADELAYFQSGIAGG